jgi:hypothetical protein
MTCGTCIRWRIFPPKRGVRQHFGRCKAPLDHRPYWLGTLAASSDEIALHSSHGTGCEAAKEKRR